MLNHSIRVRTLGAEIVANAVREHLGESYEIERQRLARDIERSGRRQKGRPNRSILAARVEDGVLHTYHATKGARRRRIAPSKRRVST